MSKLPAKRSECHNATNQVDEQEQQMSKMVRLVSTHSEAARDYVCLVLGATETAQKVCRWGYTKTNQGFCQQHPNICRIFIEVLNRYVSSILV